MCNAAETTGDSRPSCERVFVNFHISSTQQAVKLPQAGDTGYPLSSHFAKISTTSLARWQAEMLMTTGASSVRSVRSAP